MSEPPVPPAGDPAPAPAPDASHRRSAEVAERIAAARRRWKRTLLVSGALIFGCMAAGEIAARVSGVRPITRLAPAGERGWGPAPGTVTIDGAAATFSPSGTRGPEAPPGGLLLLGDEIALGPGLADADTVGAVLGRESGRPVTVAACDGYGLAQEVLWLRELAPRLRPRAVVVVYALDDPRPFAATLFTRARFRLQSFSALAASVFPGTRPMTRAELSALYDPDGVGWGFLEDGMRGLGKWSREARTPVILAVWPWMTRQDDALAEYFERVRGPARAEGLIVHPLLEDLGAEGLEKRVGANGRPDAEAHRRAGTGLAALVKDVLGD